MVNKIKYKHIIYMQLKEMSMFTTKRQEMALILISLMAIWFSNYAHILFRYQNV